MEVTTAGLRYARDTANHYMLQHGDRAAGIPFCAHVGSTSYWVEESSNEPPTEVRVFRAFR